MYSFYGGKQGISFIIVHHFDNVAQMLEKFSQGGLYTEVNYGEYIIIDTIVNDNKKSSIENGLVYRRGYRYDEAFALAPSKDDYMGEDGYLDQSAYEKAMNQYFTHPGAGAEYIGKIVGPQGDTPRLEVMKESEVEKLIEEFQEGFAGEGHMDVISGELQKTVTYAYCNLRDEDGNIVGCTIGLTVPYHHFTIHAESVSPYSGTFDGTNWNYEGLISKESGNDDADPYRSTWGIKIPHGIRGTNVHSVGVDTAKEYQYYYELKDFLKKEEGEITRYYLDGIFHDVIESVEFDKTTSEYVFNFTHSETKRFKARFLEYIRVNEDYQIEVTYSDFDDAGNHIVEVIGEPIRFIKSIQFDKNGNSKLEVTYNVPDANGSYTELINEPINFIEDVALKDYQLLIYFSDPARRVNLTTEYNGKKGWLNLGNVRGERGGVMVVGTVATVNDLPAGGPPEGYKGWFYEVENTSDPEDNMLYAYDYINNTGWFPVPSLTTSASSPETVMLIAKANEDGSAPAVEDNLNVNGVWFVVKD